MSSLSFNLFSEICMLQIYTFLFYCKGYLFTCTKFNGRVVCMVSRDTFVQEHCYHCHGKFLYFVLRFFPDIGQIGKHLLKFRKMPFERDCRLHHETIGFKLLHFFFARPLLLFNGLSFSYFLLTQVKNK